MRAKEKRNFHVLVNQPHLPETRRDERRVRTLISGERSVRSYLYRPGSGDLLIDRLREGERGVRDRPCPLP